MSETNFASIKYVTDGNTATVPLNYFKVIVTKVSNVKDLCKGAVYKVFWSPIVEESPMDVIETGNEVLDVDDLPELERKRRMSSNKGPLKGYYNALLLQLKESEEVNLEIKRELSESNCLPKNVKRARPPSLKAIEAHQQSKPKATVKDNTKKNVKISAELASQKNILDLLSKCPTKKTKSESDYYNPTSPEEDGETSSDDEIDAAYWKRKYEQSVRKSGKGSLEKEERKKKKKKSHKSSSKDRRDSTALQKPVYRSSSSKSLDLASEYGEAFRTWSKNVDTYVRENGVPSNCDGGSGQRYPSKTSVDCHMPKVMTWSECDESKSHNKKSRIAFSNDLSQVEVFSPSPPLKGDQTNANRSFNCPDDYDEQVDDVNCHVADKGGNETTPPASPLDSSSEHAVDNWIVSRKPSSSKGGNERKSSSSSYFNIFSEQIDNNGSVSGQSSGSKSGNEKKSLPTSPHDRSSEQVDNDVSQSPSSKTPPTAIRRRKRKAPKPGADGDSLAIMDFASTLWDDDELIIRSPTGLPNTKKPGSVAYPAMTPPKVKKCREFLKQRILEENPSAPSSEIQLRIDRVEYYLGQKISSKRKSFVRRGLRYPTSEEVAAKRGKK